LGLALPLLVELALGAAHREAPNGDRLAPNGIPLVLEMEESARRSGKADDRLGSSETDPKDKFGEPALGSTAYPRGTAQTWYRSIPSHGREVHGAPAEAAISDVGAFLNNHVQQLVSTDFFVVSTVTFRVLYVFIVLAHQRRRPLHFNVTANPTSEWTAQQLVEAFPWGNAPRYLLHDRDSIYEGSFRQRVRQMAIQEVLTAPRSPWQNPYAERLVGSIRRECLDHILVLNESSLRRMLKSYFQYYLHWRTHLALAKDAPEPRAIQSPELGPVVEIPEVGGLHHRYERRAA
jgi:putative transposase